MARVSRKTPAEAGKNARGVAPERLYKVGPEGLCKADLEGFCKAGLEGFGKESPEGLCKAGSEGLCKAGSERLCKAGSEGFCKAAPERLYRAAAYVRLSVEDGKGGGGESIAMQRYMLEKYIGEQPDMVLQGIYCDSGETGTDFARPGFERMMDRVREREADCIVVKDLSRFGRNYVEAGYYLEKIFPHMGVRFVAVNDHYDTLKDGDGDGMVLSLKNMVNDLYARDISQKTVSALDIKRKNGEYIGAVPPYGYLKSPEDKHKLAADPEAAGVVRDIFRWRASGAGAARIARRLNEAGVPSPALHYYRKGYTAKEPSGAGRLWKASGVRRMLGNPVYAGHMAQGRTRKYLSGGIPKREVPREEWIIVRNTHPPIVDGETFDRVQELMGERRRGISASVSARGESARGELAKGESVRGESARGELAKGESVRGESVRGESARGELAKGELAKGESARGESARGEPAKGKCETAENVFKGLVVCSECGGKMVRHKSVSAKGTARYAFVCSIYEQNRGVRGCAKKYVRERDIREAVLWSLRLQTAAVDVEKLLGAPQKQGKGSGQGADFGQREEAEDRTASVRRKLRRVTSLRGTLYESFCDGVLARAEYLSLKAEYDRKAQALEEELAGLQEESRADNERFAAGKKWLASLREYHGGPGGREGAFTGKMARELLRSIRVSGYNELEIIWNFRDGFVQAAEWKRNSSQADWHRGNKDKTT